MAMATARPLSSRQSASTPMLWVGDGDGGVGGKLRPRPRPWTGGVRDALAERQEVRNEEAHGRRRL
jgi:hypothetical protein